MPALAHKTYFNYGGQGPLPTPSLEAIQHCWSTIQELGPFTNAVWPVVEGTVAGLRQRLARWLGVGSQRLAFTENVTSGCVLPLWGLPWTAGDHLLISDCEHPGVVAACREVARRHQLQIRPLAIADLRGSVEEAEALVLERLEAALTPQTRLVVISHLLWNTGQLMPIPAIAALLRHHPASPWLLVDGAQSLGSLPVQEAAAAADIYACTGHKWCCGPEGLGVVALSERLLAEARPTLIGWRSLSDEGSAEGGFHADARRFEVATSCIPLFAGLDQSLQLLEAEGSDQARHQRIQQLAHQLWSGLQDNPALDTLLTVPPPAGLVSFQLRAADDRNRDAPSDAINEAQNQPAPSPEAMVNVLGQQGIWLRSLAEPACLRACTHIVTEPAELEQLLVALAAGAGP
jgi:L-cysteine/cystine lyase